jgi:hypothetical protein
MLFAGSCEGGLAWLAKSNASRVIIDNHGIIFNTVTHDLDGH